MGYPPHGHRPGDKKRYYYSNNPNRRHGPPFAKKSHGFFHAQDQEQTSIQQSLNPNLIPQAKRVDPLPPATANGITSYADAGKKASRYDPNSSMRPTSSHYRTAKASVTTTPLPATATLTTAARNTGSRYNPEMDSKIITSTHGTKSSMPIVSKETSSVVNTSEPIRSRYSGSASCRYSIHHQPSSPNVGPPNRAVTPSSNSSPKMIQRQNQGSISVPSSSSLPGLTSRKPTASRNQIQDQPKSDRIDTYPQRNSSVNNIHNVYHSSDPLANANAASNYYQRSNKWKSSVHHSSSASKIDMSGYNMVNSIPTTNVRPSIWKSHSSRPSTPSTMIAQIAPPSSSSVINDTIPNSTSIKHVSDNKYLSKTTVPPDRKDNIEPYISTAHFTEVHGGHDITSNKDDKTNIRNENNITHKEPNREEKHRQQEQHVSYKPSSNPHSLGSSLFNSVPRTTRETEQRKSVAKLPKETPPDLQKVTVDKKSASSNLSDNKIKKRGDTDNFTMWTSLSKKEQKMTTEDGKTNLKRKKSLITSDKISDKNEPLKEEIEGAKINRKKTTIIETAVKNVKQEFDYEHVHDPELLKIDLSKLQKYTSKVPYSNPKSEITECIFPLSEVETKLWELKNKARLEITEKQKYLLKVPITSLREHSFFEKNIQFHHSNIRKELYKKLLDLKNFEDTRITNLKKLYFRYEKDWDVHCNKMERLSNELRKEEIESKRKLKEEQELKEKQEKEQTNSQNNIVTAGIVPRRRNRADFVDDDEIESVLLQIDPDYRHHQAAASIPPLIIDPVKKIAQKFKDVNNLVTDKNEWATRIVRNGIDTFTKDEHELFADAYVMYPKKFGKISHYMGSLRSPEECVLHYYRTKKTIDYKALLLEKNKRKKHSNPSKRRIKKKERSIDEVISDQSIKTNEPNIFQEAEVVNDDVDVAKHEEPHVKVQNESLDEKLPITGLVAKEAPVSTVASEINAQNPRISNGTIDKTTLPETNHEASDTSIEVPNLVAPPVLDTSSSVTMSQRLPPINMAEIQYGGTSMKRTSDQQSSTSNDGSTAMAGGQDDAANRDQTNETDQGQIRKKQKTSSDHKSSYWSVKEAYAFPELLQEYGSQWSVISQKLGSKSTTMVRNYYQRNAAQYGWKSIVEESDNKRNTTRNNFMQQAQMVMQPDQANTIPHTFTSIPPQQRPALAFFTNQPDSISQDKQEVGTPTNPFSSEIYKEPFSKVTTPKSTLPPPKLSAIQLKHPGSSLQHSSSLPGTFPPSINIIDGHTVMVPVGSQPQIHQENLTHIGGSSINDILNTGTQLYGNEALASSPTYSMQRNVNVSNKINSSLGQVVIQELQASNNALSSGPKSSSILSLLNPETNGNAARNVSYTRPSSAYNYALPNINPYNTMAPLQTAPQVQTPLPGPPSSSTASLPQHFPINQRMTELPKLSNVHPTFNFSTDPLAALAAVASAPENMPSFSSNNAASMDKTSTVNNEDTE
ncbi:Snt1p NDAI_0A00740 [Naumovozyma dairenensis CBS 421]|uniref:SANT domain-containing protein n=1 Tax=Naumovozyma dairenensis (strain ATCC 10597 / BCRC 20456 / CBS 421 / NBRC 0211 / NRRL Y-12639) TaxID=1071378 RepID=G0W344_NAUDC|nr:hypothetical protein NDAI_0A00740 [Naumovozyma dairenensis CBS 421]CCD22232.1 hypothetical protein NDAI_0A00740 [Naumovozyma dairenensis CBS 421]